MTRSTSLAFVGAVLVTSLGACPAPRTAVRHTLSLPLGKVRGGCAGADRIVKPQQTTTIQKQLDSSGDVCRHAVSWKGRLLDFASGPLGKAKAKGYELAVVSIRLVDALGNAIAEAPALKIALSLALDGTKLVAVEGSKAPYGLPKTTRLADALATSVRAQHAQRQSLDGTVDVKVDLSNAGRKALAGKAPQPQLELVVELRPIREPDKGS